MLQRQSEISNEGKLITSFQISCAEKQFSKKKKKKKKKKHAFDSGQLFLIFQSSLPGTPSRSSHPLKARRSFCSLDASSPSSSFFSFFFLLFIGSAWTQSTVRSSCALRLPLEELWREREKREREPKKKREKSREELSRKK